MTTNQIYNTLIKLLKTRGYKCYRCEPEIGGSKSDKIVDKYGGEHIQHLWQTCKYYLDTVGVENGMHVVERVYQTVVKALKTQEPIETLEDFYDKHINDV